MIVTNIRVRSYNTKLITTKLSKPGLISEKSKSGSINVQPYYFSLRVSRGAN